MRTVRVRPFEGDELLYRFSRSGVPAPRPRTWEQLLQDLSGAGERSTVMLSGGNPLEHPDLARALEAGRAAGVKRFRVVTDGFGLDDPSLRRTLRDLGARDLVVVLPTVDPTQYGTLAGDGTRLASVLAGIEAAVADGLAVHLAVPIVAAVVPGIDALMDQADTWGVDGVLVEVPDPGRVPRDKRSLLLSPRDAAGAAARVFGRCRRGRRAIGVVERWSIPACAADGQLDEYGSLFNRLHKHQRVRGGDGARRIDACGDCDLSSACQGVPGAWLDAFGSEGLRPIPLAEANGWYTKPLNRLDEIPFKRFSPYKNTERSGARGLLRVNGHCNMGCSFCFVDLSQPDLPLDSLKAEVDALRASGVTELVLSGGEPTLHPGLVELVRYAATKRFRSIELQTNGVRLASRPYAEQLADAGLSIACVSLHSHDAGVSDAITKQAGAWQRSVQALHNLHDLGLQWRISHVISRLNHPAVPAFVRFAQQEFPHGRVDICFAIAQEISSETSTWVLPTFTEIKPSVVEALDYCLAHGITFSGLIGQGSYPPCMLGGDLRYYEAVLDQTHRSGHDDWHKAERCRDCSFDARCVGIRKSYVATWGDDEIQPFS